tara:strand:+ start:848 stop:1897 length:1050 start_codon:yes stop_codon:yes gene_type:complete
MNQNKLQIESVKIVLENTTILNDINFAIKSGEIVSLMGSSASGKTSLIRSIAGYQNIASGVIKIDNNIVDNTKIFIGVDKRNTGVIFQDLALFPHLTVRENIIFGLYKKTQQDKNNRAAQLEDMLNISSITNRYPHQISGGQQQRVAIARAIAPKPTILLLDEPFSALDEELKESLMNDIKYILKKEATTAILITHNPKEAFTMSDKIAFLSDGKICQYDTPYNIYHKPLSKEIANFFGITSFLKATIKDTNHIETVLGTIFGNTEKFKKGEDVYLLIRPDDIIHDDNSTESARVVDKIFYGSDFLYKLELKDKQKIYCYTPSHHNHSINENIGIKPVIDHLILFNNNL